MAFCKQFAHGDFVVVVEDDDRVGYAYLVDRGTIVADVWLYNCTAAPQQAPWRTVDGTRQMPFQNPVDYVLGDGRLPGASFESVDVSWSQPPGIGSHPAYQAVIRVHDQPIGRLVPGAKPGWSALVRRDGPLARAWSSAAVGADAPGREPV